MKAFIVVVAALLSVATAHPQKASLLPSRCFCKPPICPLELIAECKCKNQAAQACYEKYLADGIQCPKPTPTPCGIIAREPTAVPTRVDPISIPIKPTRTPIVDYPRCGGFAGFRCPSDEYTCIDDPRDDCDPKHGGADCMGICVPKKERIVCGGLKGFECPKGYFCIDDPFDKCDPKKGGADCIGICLPDGLSVA